MMLEPERLTRDELLEKYGHLEFVFTQFWKYSAYFRNDEENMSFIVPTHSETNGIYRWGFQPNEKRTLDSLFYGVYDFTLERFPNKEDWQYIFVERKMINPAKPGTYLCRMLNGRYQSMFFTGTKWCEPFGIEAEPYQVRAWTNLPDIDCLVYDLKTGVKTND